MRRASLIVVFFLILASVPFITGSDGSDAEDDGAEIPETYFMGDYYKLPEVRDQGAWGTCYSFAVAAAIESRLYLDGYELDLSELYIAASSYFDDDRGVFLLTGNDGAYFEGGDEQYSLQVLASRCGTALEADVPYSDISDDYVPSEDVPNVLYVTGFTILLSDDVESIKQHIMSGTMATMSTNGDNCSQTYTAPDGRTYTVFDYSVDVVDHAMALVGWDDTVPGSYFGPETPGDGAWIVRNSWGSDDFSGYFLVSYYSSLDLFIFVDSYLFMDDSLNLYCYDYVPGECSYKVNSAANMFVADGYETLRSVSFEAYSDDLDYTVSVFKGCREGQPTSGKLVSTTSGHLDYSGLVNVDLENPVDLLARERFSIVVSFGDDGGNICVEYTDAEAADYGWYMVAVSESGQSFFDEGYGWVDIGAYGNLNLRIKAITVDRDVSTPISLILMAALTASIIVAAVSIVVFRSKHLYQ